MNDDPARIISSTPEVERSGLLLWMAFLGSVILLMFTFRVGLADMVRQWDLPEYSHGFMIPLVALYIVWQKQDKFPAAMKGGSWAGVGFFLVGLILFFVGQTATIFEVVQYGFLLSLFALTLSFSGWRVISLIWVAFAYLIFMIPLPSFVYQGLSNQLQLISSYIGVVVIRWFDITVYLEGNVIDLGIYQLQVVEACSGLRYLFPLMSFGFLIAYLFQGPMWQRVFLFLSTIPITVLMNSFRIGVIGVTVEYWGIEMAEGFLHDFEGWVIFMGCLGVLVIEMLIFHWFAKTDSKLIDRLDLDLPDNISSFSSFNVGLVRQRPFLVCLALLVGTSILYPLSESKNEVELERKSFNEFPLYYGQWRGVETALEKNILDKLKLTDYIQANYRAHKHASPINLYVAYYKDQRQGAAIHSPRTCIPGGGWSIADLTQRTIPKVIHPSGAPLSVNRLVISNEGQAQIVYYWFDERGRNITNEYWAKWYKLVDSFTLSRTDGALVRVIISVPDISKIDQAEEHLIEFVQEFYPLLTEYIPSKKL